MVHRAFAVLAAAVFAAGAFAALPGLASAKTFLKLPAKGSVLTGKNGYWVECSSSGSCQTVYARGKNGKFRRLAANGGTTRKVNGYVQVCYDGANNAVICYWVYERAKSRR